MDGFIAATSAPIPNKLGLHARPSVQLTKLAKTFQSRVEVARAPEGPWVDAKSIVKVMAVKAPKGTVLHFRATGPDDRAALDALCELVSLSFHEQEADPAEATTGSVHG